MAQFYSPRQAAKNNRKRLTPGNAIVLQDVEVEGLSHQAEGIVRSKQTYFVPNTLPNERVSLKIVGQRAEVTQWHRTSAQRVTPLCADYLNCGGCDLMHLEHDAQLAHKQKTVTELLQKFADWQGSIESIEWQPPLTVGPWQTRSRTRLACWYNRKQRHLALGLRQRGSKAVVEMAECPVLAPELQRLLSPLRELLNKLQLAKTLGHVELMLAPQPLVLLRLTEPLSKADAKQLSECELHADIVVQGADNRLQWLRGQGHAHYRSYLNSELGIELGFLPGQFVQANAELNSKMVAQAVSWLQPRKNEHVLDLFAGTGNFTCALGAQAERVLALEGDAGMTAQILANASKQGLMNVNALAVDLNQALPDLVREFAPQAVLLDPARPGALQAVKSIVEKLTSVKRILYVSCAPDTFARDLKVLFKAGYSLRRCGIVDMFPQTHHIEVMAELNKI